MLFMLPCVTYNMNIITKKKKKKKSDRSIAWPGAGDPRDGPGSDGKLI